MDANAWKCIATVGIWIGVGMCSFGAPMSVAEVSGAAFGATFFMWMFG